MDPRRSVTVELTPVRLLATLSGVALVAGALGPWIDVGFFRVSGANALGVVPIVAGVATIVLSVLDRWPLAYGVLGAFATAIAAYVVVSVGRTGNGVGQLALGWGVVLVIVAGLAVTVLGLVQVWSIGRAGVAASAIAVVIISAGVAIGATVDVEDDEPSNSIELASEPSATMAPIPTIAPIPTLEAEKATPTPRPRPADAGPATPNSCPGGVRVASTTTCQFAADIASNYYIAASGGTLNSDGSGTVVGWSDALQETIDLYCEPAGADVVCQGGAAAVVRFTRP